MSDLKINQPRLLWQLQWEGPWPMAVVFGDSCRKVYAGNQQGQLLMWELPDQPPAFEPPKNNPVRLAPSIPPRKLFQGHTNGITKLAVTPDGQWIISASLDRTVRIWDTRAEPTGEDEVILDSETRQEEVRRTKKEDILQQPGVPVTTHAAAHVFEGHRDWIETLALSRDGRRILSGDNSSHVFVWDLAERKPVAQWRGHPWNWIVAAAFTPDGQRALVSEYRYKRDDFDIPCPAIKLWSVADAAELLDLLRVQFPNYKPDENSYGSAQVWRKFVANGLIAADISPNGKLIALGQGGETEKGQVHLLDTETGKLVRTVSEHLSGVTDVRFSESGQYLLTTGRDTTVRILQVEDGKEVAALGAPRGGQFKDWFSSLAISADQQAVAASDIAGYIHVWTLSS